MEDEQPGGSTRLPWTDRTPVSQDQFHPHEVLWTPEKVERFWDYASAHQAGDFFSEKHARDIASRLISAASPTSVVDIGCGTGPLVAEFVRRGVKATGVDSSPGALDVARQRAPNATFHLGSVASLPITDGTMDSATLIETVEHLDDETMFAALAEVKRVLRTGGMLLVTTPNNETLDESRRQCPDCGAEFHLYQHVRTWTAQSLRVTLQRSGLTPVSIRATRLLENVSGPERIVRRAYYRFRRQAPRLVALARA